MTSIQPNVLANNLSASTDQPVLRSKPNIKIRTNIPNSNLTPVLNEVKSPYVNESKVLQNVMHKPLPRNLNVVTVKDIKPVFCLKETNIKTTAHKYFAGEFKSRTIKPNAIKIITNIVDISKIGTSYRDPIYKLELSGGESRMIATTSVNILEFNYLGYKDQIPECMCCRRKFVNCDINIPIGIPIHMRTVDGILVYTMDGIYCGFQCAYSALLSKLDNIFTRIIPGYYNSEIMLHNIFNKIYPSEADKLKAVPIPELLNTNQGSLTESAYFSEKKTYINLGFNTYPMLPNDQIKFEYVKNDFLIENP